jgi:hypothetical protein
MAILSTLKKLNYYEIIHVKRNPLRNNENILTKEQ